MFKAAMDLEDLEDGPECKACQSAIDCEDEASFVSVSEERFRRNVHQPLVVFFLYSGDNKLTDKLCMNCFDKFMGISEFYKKCKNSKSEYTPCFRDSSTGSEYPRSSTARILSTETPDMTSTASYRRRPTPDLLSSVSRTVPTQTMSDTQETQSHRPLEKKSYVIHHDLGIRLPKPILKQRGCFDDDDFCYLMLQDEFNREKERTSSRSLQESKAILGCELKHPPISAHVEMRSKNAKNPHTHIANCPFCPALIHRKHPHF